MFFDTLRADIRHTLPSRDQDAGVHRADDPGARARHRRHHRDLRGRQRRAPATAALSRRCAARQRLELQHHREPAAQSAVAGQLPRLPEDEHDARRAGGLLHLRDAGAAADRRAAPRSPTRCSSPPNMFNMLGRSAALGRVFAAGEENAVIVLSDGYWRRRFGADPNIVGTTLTLNGSAIPGDRRDAARFRVPVSGHARAERVHARHAASTCGCRSRSPDRWPPRTAC